MALRHLALLMMVNWRLEIEDVLKTPAALSAGLPEAGCESSIGPLFHLNV